MNYTLTTFIILYTVYLLLISYERRILNLRRISFASSILSLATVLTRVPFHALLPLLAVIYSPSWITYLIASLPLVPFYPLPILLMTVYVYLIDRYGTLKWGIAWLRSWMGDDYYLLDLLSHKEGRYVENGSYLIARNVAIIGSHFGLMRCAQGSLIPHFLSLCGIVGMKGCGSHERNPATSWEAFKIVKEVLSVPCEGGKLKVELLEDENWRILRINNDACIMYSKVGSDDIPCIFEKSIGCLIGDSHSNEGWMYPSFQGEKISEWEVDEVEICEVKIKGEKLCDERGYLVKLGRVDLLVVFANNLEGESSRKLVQRGLWPITVDDHSCAGIEIGKSHEAGRVKDFELVRCWTSKACGRKFYVKYRAGPEWVVSEGISKAMTVSLVSFILTLLVFFALALTF